MNPYIAFLQAVGITYGATTIASLIANQIYYNGRINKAYKDSKRSLKYKELSLKGQREIDRIKEFCRMEKLLSIIVSMIPLYQIEWTILNIQRNSKQYDEFFLEKIDNVNKVETSVRKELLEDLRSREVPEDIRIKMQDENYLPTEEDFLRATKSKKKVKKLPAEENPLYKELDRLYKK